MADAIPAATPNTQPAEPERPNSWPRSVQGAVALFLLLAFLFLGRSALSTSNALPVERGAQRIDINRAGRAELLLLPGVGDVLAERILDHREKRGPFKKVDDLGAIKGVGPATLERLHSWVTVGPASSSVASAERSSLVVAPIKAAHQAAAARIVDLNSANTEELQALPGIGVVLSQRIVEERAKKPFAVVADLRRVKGIGPKTLEKVRPYVVISPFAE